MSRIKEIGVDADAPWQHELGSPEAVREGRTCSQALNNGGKGVMHALLALLLGGGTILKRCLGLAIDLEPVPVLDRFQLSADVNIV
jgi:hypothetical protein